MKTLLTTTAMVLALATAAMADTNDIKESKCYGQANLLGAAAFLRDYGHSPAMVHDALIDMGTPRGVSDALVLMVFVYAINENAEEIFLSWFNHCMSVEA